MATERSETVVKRFVLYNASVVLQYIKLVSHWRLHRTDSLLKAIQHSWKRHIDYF